MSDTVQLNFELNAKEFAPLAQEAVARGMTDRTGSPNRAMIARALVLERMAQINPSQSSNPRLAALTAVLAADPVALTLAELVVAKRRRSKRRAA